jgi:hypothetical protein
VVTIMDEITRRIVDETIADHDRQCRDFELWEWERRRKQLPAKQPEPEPPTEVFTSAQLDELFALADDVGATTADLQNQINAQHKSLVKRIERLERLEEIEQLRAENEELRQKAAQLERRVVFVDLAKTRAAEQEHDIVVDLAEARAATRGRDVA